MRQFRPWQQLAFDYAAPRNTIMLCMDKRLGKCQVAIRWAELKDAHNIAVITPLSAVGGWIDEIKYEEHVPVPLHKSWSMDPLHELTQTWGTAGRHFFLMNPQGLWDRHKSTLKPIVQAPYDAVILDECVCIKNPKTKINEVMNDYFSHVPLRAGLTGEVAPEGPEDLFEQYRWVHGQFMGHTNFWKWRFENFKPTAFGYGWYPMSGRLAAIKSAARSSSFTISRKSAGVENEPPRYERCYCNLPETLVPTYNEIAKLYTHGDWEAKYAVEVATMLERLCGGYPENLNVESQHKMDLLVDIVINTFQDEPLVVLFKYNKELMAARDALLRKNVSCAFYNGSVSPAERDVLRRRFAAGGFRVMLAQAQAAMYGLDLSRSSTMIRYSVPVDFNVVSQSADRIVMPGKQDILLYVDLCVKDTVDEDRVMTITDKKFSARYFMEDYAARLMARFRREQTHVERFRQQ